MCRGLAIVYEKESGKIACKGVSSHSETSPREGLDYEVIVTDKNKAGYKVLIGWEYMHNEKEGREAKAYLPHVRKWVKGNEKEVLRMLLHCQEYADRKGDTHNDYQETKGSTYNDNQKTSGNTDNSRQETGGNTKNSRQDTGGHTYNDSQETGGEWYMGMLKLRKYPNATKLIRTIKGNWNLTIREALSWVANNPEKAKKILGKELAE